MKVCYYYFCILTHTDRTIPSITRFTVTGEATRSVSTGSMRITVMSTSSTLINIYDKSAMKVYML